MQKYFHLVNRHIFCPKVNSKSFKFFIVPNRNHGCFGFLVFYAAILSVPGHFFGNVVVIKFYIDAYLCLSHFFEFRVSSFGLRVYLVTRISYLFLIFRFIISIVKYFCGAFLQKLLDCNFRMFSQIFSTNLPANKSTYSRRRFLVYFGVKFRKRTFV